MIDGMIQLLTELSQTYEDDYKHTVVIADFENTIQTSKVRFILARIDGVRAKLFPHKQVLGHVALASIACGNIEYWYGSTNNSFYKLSETGQKRIDDLDNAIDNLLKEVQSNG